MNSTVGTPIQKADGARNLFRSRLTLLAALFGCCFFVVFCRMWQLQISRHDTYHALATRGSRSAKVVPALRGPIFDRNGGVLAEDRPYYDISVRFGELKFASFDMEKVRAARERFKDDTPSRDAEFDRLAAEIRTEPYVRQLSETLRRDEAEIAAGMIKAIDSVTRTPPWASPKTPVRVVGGVDEKTWLSLRAAHEDVFRYPPGGGVDPPFPGLACTLSTRRVYPNGKLACFVLGALGELDRDDEEALKKDGILLENAASRRQYWEQLREGLDDARAAKIERLLRIHPQDIRELTDLYAALSKLRPQEVQTAASLGLAEPLRWMDRPPRMVLTPTELLWTGVGLPATESRNALPNRTVGELGVERWYNDWLRGKSGMKIRGTIANADEDALQYRDNSQPREGEPLALTISLTWQRAVEKALSQEHKGAIVVIDVKTGDILAMASNPGFDPNLFSPPRDGQERQAQLRALLNDPDKPLLNRAIAEQYPLGSVMKALVACVALEKGLVSTTETFECPGYIVEGGQKFRCDDSRPHGTVNLYKAIRCSCNGTFQQIGARIGVENMAPYARQIFGRRSGVELSGETPGIFPDREWRMRAYPTQPSARIWTRGNDFLLAIGQGQFSCSVIQSAQLMAAIANNGTVLPPRLWLDGPRPAPLSLGISPQNIAIVREGLDEVVNVGTPGSRGTAYSAFHEQGPELAVRVAGKTSTAEHKKGAKSHAWFAGYAPSDRPQVAFAIILEEAGHGGATAAPIAYKFLRDIYGTRLSPHPNPGAPVAEVLSPNSQH